MAVEGSGASERFVCKILGQNRCAFRKKKPDMGFDEAALRAVACAVAVKHPVWGWWKARWHLYAKRVRRLWRQKSLTFTPKARTKRRTGPGQAEDAG